MSFTDEQNERIRRDLIREDFRWLSGTKTFTIENDVDFLLHRLPEEVKSARYNGDETHTRALLETLVRGACRELFA